MNHARRRGLTAFLFVALMLTVLFTGASAFGSEQVRKELESEINLSGFITGPEEGVSQEVLEPPVYTVHQASAQTESGAGAGGVIDGIYPQEVHGGEHTVYYAADQDYRAQSVTVIKAETGDHTVIENPGVDACVITGIDGDISIVVTFAPVSKVAAVARGGEITSVVQDADHPGTYTITYAPADASYAFEKAEIVRGEDHELIDGASDTTCQITGVTEQVDVVVTFAKKQADYRVVAYLPELAPNDSTYQEADLGTFSAVVGEEVSYNPENAEFEGFSFNEENENNVLSAVLAEDGSTTLAVYFARNVYTLTYQVRPDSDIIPSTVLDTEEYEYEEVVTLPEVPDVGDGSGIELIGWFQNVENIPSDPGSTFSMPSMDLTARAVGFLGNKPVLQICVTSPQTLVYTPEGYDFLAVTCSLQNAIGYSIDDLIIELNGIEVVAEEISPVGGRKHGPDEQTKRFMLQVGRYSLDMDVSKVEVYHKDAQDKELVATGVIQLQKCLPGTIEVIKADKFIPQGNAYVEDVTVVYDREMHTVNVVSTYADPTNEYSLDYDPATGKGTFGTTVQGYVESSEGRGIEGGWPVYVKFPTEDRNYNLICEGRVTILQRPVKVSANADTKEYNGLPYNDTGEKTFTNGTEDFDTKITVSPFDQAGKTGLVPGHELETITVKSVPAETDVNIYPENLHPSTSSFSITATNGDVEPWRNYKIEPTPGQFTVTRRGFTVVAASKEMPYTGNPYTDENGIEFTAGAGERWPQAGVQEVINLLDGHVLKKVTITSQPEPPTNAPPVAVDFYEKNLAPSAGAAGWDIVDNAGNSVAANYTATPVLVNGDLTITRRHGSLDVEGGSKIYDGDPIGVTFEQEPGDKVQYSLTGEDGTWQDEPITQTIPGEQDVWVRVERDNETLTGKGTLVVTNRPITIEAIDQEYFYNGMSYNKDSGSKIYTANYAEGVRVVNTEANEGLAAGQDIYRVVVSSKGGHKDVNQDPTKGSPYVGDLIIGERPDDLMIKNAAGDDVTAYYTITRLPGDLTIRPREVHIAYRDPNKEKDYDGDPTLPTWETVVHGDNKPDGGVIGNDTIDYTTEFDDTNYPQVGNYESVIVTDEAANPNYNVIVDNKGTLVIYGRVTYNSNYPQGYPKNGAWPNVSYRDEGRYTRGEEVRRMLLGEVQEKEPAFVSTGLMFLGWRQDGSVYEQGTRFGMGPVNVELYAEWQVNRYKLTVQHRAENDPSVKVAEDTVIVDIEYGDPYYETAVQHASYTALTPSVQGTMPATDLVLTIYYREKGPEPNDKHALTVQHVLLSDPTMRIAEDTVVTGLNAGDAYNVPAITHDTYVALVERVQGTMPDSDLVLMIYYKEKGPDEPGDKYTLTVRHRVENQPDLKVAEDVVIQGLLEGTPYYVSAVSHERYSPLVDHVSGEMPAEDLVLTIFYKLKTTDPGHEYTLTVEHLLVSDPSVKVAQDTVITNLKAGDAFNVPAVVHASYVALMERVVGNMPASDLTLAIYYKEKGPDEPGDKYTLTVQHRVKGQPDEKVAEDTVITGLKAGDAYNVSAVDRDGYTPLVPSVQGNMPANDLVLVIEYEPDEPEPEYTLTVEHLLVSDPSVKVASDTVITNLKAGDAFDVPAVVHASYVALMERVTGNMPASDLKLAIYYKEKGPDEPGDKYTLTVQHRVKGQPDVKVADDTVIRNLKAGDAYFVTAVDRDGYTPLVPSVQGNMPANDLVLVIEYELEEPETFTLTVKHLLVSDPNVSVAADTVITDLEAGDAFNVPAVTHASYIALMERVTGNMPASDLTLAIYYKEKGSDEPGDKYTLTVQHRVKGQQNVKVAEDTVIPGLKANDPYYVLAVKHAAYVAVTPYVQGNMPASDLVLVIEYEPAPEEPGDKYTLTVEHRLISDPNVRVSNDTVVMDLRAGDTYNVPAILHANYVALMERVTGTMPAGDFTTVIYYKDKGTDEPGDTYTLTVRHRVEGQPDVRVAADTVIPGLKANDPYYVLAVQHATYTALAPYVQGTMPADDLVLTIYYKLKGEPEDPDKEYTLTVQHRLVSDPNVRIADDTVVNGLKADDPYNVSAVLHASYEALTERVAGTMPNGNLVLAIYYREKGTDEPGTKYTLTVRHRVEGQPDVKVAEDTVIAGMKANESYYVSAVQHDRYTALTPYLQGTMPASDLTVTIYYRLKGTDPSEKYTLTVQHRLVTDPNVSVAADTVLTNLEAGAAYDVPAVQHVSYTALVERLSGNMPASDLVLTIYYQAKTVAPETYTLTVQHRVVDNPSQRVASDTVVANLKSGDAYNVPAVLHASYTALTSNVAGTMPASDLVLTIYYKAKTTETPNTAKYTLTVQHRVEGDITKKVAEDTVIRNLESGSGYFVSAVQHASYSALTASVAGNMPANDLTLTIYYRQKTSVIGGGSTSGGTGNTGSTSTGTGGGGGTPTKTATPAPTASPSPAPTAELQTIYDLEVPLGNIASPNVGECFE